MVSNAQVNTSKRVIDKPSRLLLCFSHLRWNFVFQRPQHLLTRAASDYQVVYFEEPVFEDVPAAFVRTSLVSPTLAIKTPVLPHNLRSTQKADILRKLVDGIIGSTQYDELLLWYYTPMALPFTDHLKSDICVYDCMDELSSFKNAPREMVQLEKLLMQRADVVFTGGVSIYDAKRALHDEIYPFPSSIDVAHFHKARIPAPDCLDQAHIPHPRIGYFGVIDERLDTVLVSKMAQAMPNVHFVMIGPTAKIDPDALPQGPNIHWLGGKTYDALPAYLRHWDIGWMPFALNEATRFISPTKTPEFLAAGLPVVSTHITDVARTYGALGLVAIANADTMEEQLRLALKQPKNKLHRAVDAYLKTMSWDLTWQGMQKHFNTVNAPGKVIELAAEA